MSFVLPRLLPALLASLLSMPASAALACPAGQQAVCVVVCFCAPGSATETGPLYDRLGLLAAASLEAWIERSHAQAMLRDTQPMPLHIRARLEPYYDFAVLDSARYKVGDDETLNAAHAMLQNPDVNAVTLKNLIVFRHAADALDNTALWAHELHHVQQYLEWGVHEFALRYTRDYWAVERPAYAIQRRVEQELATTAQGE